MAELKRMIAEAMAETARINMVFTFEGKKFTVCAEGIKDVRAFAEMMDRIFEGVCKKVEAKLLAEGWTRTDVSISSDGVKVFAPNHEPPPPIPESDRVKARKEAQ